MAPYRDLHPDDREPVFADTDAARRHLRARLVLAYRMFGAMGWGDLGDGHISARDPGRTDCFWLLAYGVPFARATLDDLVLVAPDGTLLDGHGAINTSAHHIHQPIHEARPDVVCVAHTHTPFGTAWSACAEPFSMLCQEALAFRGRQALFDDGEIDVLGLDGGRRIAESLGGARMSILRNHGLLTVGADVDETLGWFLMAERVARIHCTAPSPRPIDDVDAARYDRFVADPAAAWHAFNWALRTHGVRADPTC